MTILKWMISVAHPSLSHHFIQRVTTRKIVDDMMIVIYDNDK